ncbi:MAG: FecR family protein [Bryobacteraceae bacterium]|nr:FecR family protein [Bryobacteraceae bacterium]
MQKRSKWMAALCAAIMAGPAAFAQPQDSRQEPGMARMSVADGAVEVLRGSGDRVAGRGGMTLQADDTVFTGRSSRAEIDLGPGNLIRLSEETRVRVVDIGNRYYRVEVLSGEASVSQLKGAEADIDILTPQATARPRKAGVYRVTVREGAQTDVTVRKGEAEVGPERVKSGQRVSLRGGRQSPEVRASAAEPKDAFDRWNERRDDVLEPRYRNNNVLLGGGFGYPYWGSGFWGPGWGPGLWGPGFGGGFGPRVFVGRGFGGRRRW